MECVLHELEHVQQLAAPGGTALREFVREGADEAQEARTGGCRHLGDKQDVASIVWQADVSHARQVGLPPWKSNDLAWPVNRHNQRTKLRYAERSTMPLSPHEEPRPYGRGSGIAREGRAAPHVMALYGEGSTFTVGIAASEVAGGP